MTCSRLFCRFVQRGQRKSSLAPLSSTRTVFAGDELGAAVQDGPLEKDLEGHLHGDGAGPGEAGADDLDGPRGVCGNRRCSTHVGLRGLVERLRLHRLAVVATEEEAGARAQDGVVLAKRKATTAPPSLERPDTDRCESFAEDGAWQARMSHNMGVPLVSVQVED